MKRNNIIFGFIVAAIILTIGLATINNTDSGQKSNIELLSRSTTPRTNGNRITDEGMQGPQYTFNYGHNKTGISHNTTNSPNFELPSTNRNILGSNEPQYRQRSGGSISISGGTVEYGNRGRRSISETGLTALTAIGGQQTRLDLGSEISDPFVETGPSAFAVDPGSNPGPPATTPLGDMVIPLIIFILLRAINISLVKKH